VEDHAKRAAIAVALFGRAGQSVLNLVGHVERLRQVARNIGIIIPENLLRDAERANDQMSMLTQILGAKLSVAILKQADNIATFTEKLIDAIPRVIEFAGEVAEMIGLFDKSPGNGIETQIKAIEAQMVPLIATIETAHETFAALSEVGQQGFTGQAVLDGIKNEVAELKALVAKADALKASAKPLPSLGPPIDVPDNRPGAGLPGVPAGGFIMKQSGFEQLNAALIKSRENTDALKLSMKEAGKSLTTEMLTPTEAYSARIKELNSFVEAGVISNETYARSVSRAQDEMKAAVDATDQLTASQERLASVADSTFDRIIAGASSASEILRSLAIDMAKALFLNATGGKSIGQMLVGGISDLFKADGGPVQSNRPYVVGERGPEVMVPGSSGSVVPNHKLGAAGGGGGGTIVNNFNISTGVAPTVRSEIMNLMPVITAKVKQSLMSDQTRGGPNAFAKR
jgi:hypothetical protein